MLKVKGGKSATVSFRLVEPEDAEYILSLRLDPELGLYLNPTDPSPEKQREWLAEYKKRELAGSEFFYIVMNAGIRCGTVRVICRETCFEPASMILGGDKTPTAALETALFIYKTGFEALGFDKLIFETHSDNKRALDFFEKVGFFSADANSQRRQKIYVCEKPYWETVLKRKFRSLVDQISFL